MKDASPTFAQIKAQVAAIRKKLPGTKSIAIRSKAKWSGKTSYEDNGEVFQIHQCDSPLAMRLALRESGDERTTVLVTDLDDHDISDDILVRLKPRKLIPLDSWQIVKALFQVRAVDPRVTRYGWMADVLMDLIPPNGYPPVATGFLDAETVWGIVLDHYLGLSGYSLDLLVFLDSRAGTEELGLMLKSYGVNAFVTHSSLSQEERHRTEKAFAQESDCVIVATSVLELGIDVGDLDRVIQIDAPLTVASFLQRMGRTGRRAGTVRNCLMLATKPERLLQAAALTELWESGFVEPIIPPPEPYHILSQQLMALALQESGIGRLDWFKWIEGVYGFSQLPRQSVEELVQWMIDTEILSDDSGLLWLGAKGEQTFGRQNFMELFSVFMTPPIFRVLHGRQEIGQVDESALLVKQDGPRVLSLGGNAWKVNYIDWQRKIAFVEPTDELGRTRWPGSGLGLSYKICKTMQAILCRSDQSDRWSKRCKAEIDRLRDDFSWLHDDSTSLLLESGDRWSWWTFAGAKANATLAHYLAQDLKSTVSSDGFSLKFADGVTSDQIHAAQQVLMQASRKNCGLSLTRRRLADSSSPNACRLAWQIKSHPCDCVMTQPSPACSKNQCV